MSEQELLSAVRALRAQGLAPKEISRTLGMRPATVAELVRTVAAENSAPVESSECLINAGWRTGLAVGGHPEWHDPGGGCGAEGLVTVLVARRRRHRREAAVCVYLLDTFCLGVKNALGPRHADHDRLRNLTRQVFRSYAEPPIPAPIELARELVFGAADYAGRLGFDPHPDFEAARAHLGPWTGPSSITFGRDGKPTYVDGPNDDPEQAIRTLRRAVGRRGFDYTIGVGRSRLPLAS